MGSVLKYGQRLMGCGPYFSEKKFAGYIWTYLFIGILFKDSRSGNTGLRPASVQVACETSVPVLHKDMGLPLKPSDLTLASATGTSNHDREADPAMSHLLMHCPLFTAVPSPNFPGGLSIASTHFPPHSPSQLLSQQQRVSWLLSSLDSTK